MTHHPDSLHPWVEKRWPRGGPRTKRIRLLIERDGLRCCWCQRMCDPSRRSSSDIFPTVEHLVRKADGGTNSLSNLKVACRKCNNTRHHASKENESQA